MRRDDRGNQNAETARERLRSAPKVSLRGMLTIPFILQVMAVVGLVGYLSYRNGQQSIEDLTDRLMDAVSKRIEQKLATYLESPRLVNQMASDAVRRGALTLDLERSDLQREQYLWQQMQLFPNLSWISLASERGDSVGVWRPGENRDLQISLSNPSTQSYVTYYDTDDRGIRTALLKVEKPEFDPRERPWYRAALAARQTVWTPIYAGFTPGTVSVAASQALYDRSDRRVGVIGADLSLSGIQKFLAQNPVSASGQTFVIERSGLLVASSSQESPFQRLKGQSPQRVRALDSKTPLIRAAARSLFKEVKDFKTIQQSQKYYFSTDDRGQFVKVLPFSVKGGLDWLIVIAVPEADVMAQIHAGTQTTALLCLGTLAAAIALNSLLSRWLIEPVVELSQASQRIAQGDFTGQIETPKIRELSTLADSFRQMGQEIQQSRQQLEDYSRSLEQKVNERTQALQQEVRHRATAEAALQAANQELQRLAYIDGLTQIANRRQFDEHMAQEWRRLKREQRPLSIILCDVDYFKQYNDAYGHQVGDDCLRNIAHAIASAARRPPDLAARYGGEEFAMLLPNTSLEGAVEVASYIQAYIKSLQMPHRQSRVGPYVTVSCGVTSTIPTESMVPLQLLAQVDRALYQAKSAGRDRIAIA
ncbi:diguanylate cyclase domain-containing protein [Altericista sp. CCNU0014]|uniref:diguanylate cyclase domain-containing protein n=1 Tax=Altericista sp. CCNU0014 TaxID=3082949 RepID=UPI00384ACAB3